VKRSMRVFGRRLVVRTPVVWRETWVRFLPSSVKNREAIDVMSTRTPVALLVRPLALHAHTLPPRVMINSIYLHDGHMIKVTQTLSIYVTHDSNHFFEQNL